MEEEEPSENFDYKLVGVILHMGTADAGHYLSYININRGEKDEESKEWLQTEKEKWLEFNDSTVKEFRFSNLETDCFGGLPEPQVVGGYVDKLTHDNTKNAYMLIYEKRRKEPLKIVVPENLIKAE